MSQSCRIHLFYSVFNSAKFRLLTFFFSDCYELDLFDSVNSCTLFIQKSSSIFYTEESCDRLKFDISAATCKKTEKDELSISCRHLMAETKQILAGG